MESRVGANNRIKIGCGSQQLQNKDGVQDKDVLREYVEEVYC